MNSTTTPAELVSRPPRRWGGHRGRVSSLLLAGPSEDEVRTLTSTLQRMLERAGIRRRVPGFAEPIRPCRPCVRARRGPTALRPALSAPHSEEALSREVAMPVTELAGRAFAATASPVARALKAAAVAAVWAPSILNTQPRRWHIAGSTTRCLRYASASRPTGHRQPAPATRTVDMTLDDRRPSP
jgi:hypothetical protein